MSTTKRTIAIVLLALALGLGISAWIARGYYRRALLIEVSSFLESGSKSTRSTSSVKPWYAGKTHLLKLTYYGGSGLAMLSLLLGALLLQSFRTNKAEHEAAARDQELRQRDDVVLVEGGAVYERMIEVIVGGAFGLCAVMFLMNPRAAVGQLLLGVGGAQFVAGAVIARWLRSRRPKLLDAEGLATATGKLHRWGDFQRYRIVNVKRRRSRATLARHHELTFSSGMVVIDEATTSNFAQVMAFARGRGLPLEA